MVYRGTVSKIVIHLWKLWLISLHYFISCLWKVTHIPPVNCTLSSHSAQTCCLHFLFHYGSSKYLQSVIDNIYYTKKTHKPKDTLLITLKALRTSNLTAVQRLWTPFSANKCSFLRPKLHVCSLYAYVYV